ncbi:hypothetical protein [Novosphingobium resinovorum]|uniref:hypothetical protein n=1 Tax=Novosphingobium resinovorum TaxID=158500 RepID=UPI002ED0ED50|nr:hypothetical protein [Novosphingobium resinovorum]
MTDREGGSEAPTRRAAPAARNRATLGARPILWRWWLLAALLSLGIWAGIVALAT